MKNCYSHPADCPIIFAMEILGGKWRIPILWHLAESPLRYNELKRQIEGITNIMLTRSLKELETYGFVCRKQYGEIPPHVEYSISEEGKKLMPLLYNFQTWGKDQMSKQTLPDSIPIL